MKVTTISIVTSVLLGMAALAIADDTPIASGATSVGEMLELKREHQLRDQLAQSGRWDEVRKLDAADSVRAKARREKIYEQVNSQLSDAHVDKILANQCASEVITTPKKAPDHTQTIVSTNSQ